ncbi:MAG: helix-turn-helix domain-containing protein [Sediminibacterium sp.]
MSQRYTNVFYKQETDEIGIRDFEVLPDIPAAYMNKRLFPGKEVQVSSLAVIDPYVYLCFNGRILEYVTNNFYTYSLQGNSIRSIAIYDNQLIIGTYGGVFKADLDMNNPQRIEGIEYINGYINEINNNLYFNNDILYRYDSSTNSAKIINRALDGDRFRKLIKYQNDVFALKIESIQKARLQGDNYYELEEINTINKPTDLELDEGIYYSTVSGEIVSPLFSKKISPYSIIDFDIIANKIYAASGNTLFILDKNTLEIEGEYQTEDEIFEVEVWENKIFLLTKKGFKLIIDSKIYTLIDYFEFNNKAILINKGEIYIGTINGLIKINFELINKSIIPNLEFQTLSNNLNSEINILYITLSILAISIGMSMITFFYFFRTKEQKSNIKIPFSLETIEQLIQEGKITNVNELSDFFEISRVTVNQKFKEFGFTPIEFIRKVKIEKVKSLHLENLYTNKEIGALVGYSEAMVKKILSGK